MYNQNFILGQSNPECDCVYPIIFVHGWAGSDKSWDGIYDNQDFINIYGQFDKNSQIYHAVLNATSSTNIFGNELKQNGRRGQKDDPDNYNDDDVILHTQFRSLPDIAPNKCIYAINFENYWNEDRSNPEIIINSEPISESDGNEAAIYKQGYALGQMIKKIINSTHKDKVILVCHSMGGLAAREYLQRKNHDGSGTWWAYPESNGHRVAKLLTVGTPHGGSNTADDLGLSAFLTFDLKSEALRDMRFSYNALPGSPEIPGIYLFGGIESNINTYYFNNYTYNDFWNKDINCNGNTDDSIIGINDPFSISNFNPNLRLPKDIKYTFYVSDKLDIGFSRIFGGSDGIVFSNRQWLFSGSSGTTSEYLNGSSICSPFLNQANFLSDRITTPFYATHADELGIITAYCTGGVVFDPCISETKDINTVLRGIDEGDYPYFASDIKDSKWYFGLPQKRADKVPLNSEPTNQGNNLIDCDWYKINITQRLSKFQIILNKPSLTNAITRIDLYDGAPADLEVNTDGWISTSSVSDGNSIAVSFNDRCVVEPGEYYIRITNYLSEISEPLSAWKFPYKFRVNTALITTPCVTNNNSAYIQSSPNSRITVLNTADFQTVGTLSGNEGIGAGPSGSNFNILGRQIYICNGYSDNLSIINTSNNSVLAPVTVGDYPVSILFHPNGSKYYVAHLQSNDIYVMDANTDTKIKSIPCRGSLRDMTISSDGTTLYCAAYGLDSVLIINTNSDEIVKRYSVGDGPYSLILQESQNQLFVSNSASNTISKINLLTNSVTPILVGNNPYLMRFNASKTSIYLTVGGENKVKIISPGFGAILDEIQVGAQPIGMSMDFSHNRLWVTNSLSNTISIIDLNLNEVDTTLNTNSGPYCSTGDFIFHNQSANPCDNTEICDGLDNDCDGLIDEGLILPIWYSDQDGDNYGNLMMSTAACTKPEGYVSNHLDCDDTNIMIHPGASDANCNGSDEDCDNVKDDNYISFGCLVCQLGVEVSTAPNLPAITLVQPSCQVSTGSISISNKASLDSASFNNGLSYQISGTKSNLSPATYHIKIKKVNGCISETTIGTLNTPNLVVQINNLGAAYSKSDPTFILTGTPTGGEFRIDGNLTLGNIFSPLTLSIGIHTVIYKVVQASCTSTISKQVEIKATTTPVDPILCYILENYRPLAMGNVAGPQNSSLANNALITQQNYGNLLHQKWNLEKMNNGFYRIKNKASGRYLKAGTNSTIVQGSYASPSSDWNLKINNTLGTYYIINQSKNKYLTANLLNAQYRLANASLLITPGTDQNFKFSLVNCSTTEALIAADPSLSMTQHQGKGLNRNAAARLELFPNPNSGKMSVYLSEGDIGDQAKLIIYDAYGRKVLNTSIPSNDSWKLTLDLDERKTPSGLYILYVHTRHQILEKKFIIQR